MGFDARNVEAMTYVSFVGTFCVNKRKMEETNIKDYVSVKI